MSGNPSPSKSATQTPGPNISRLMGIPSLPLKCVNLIPAAAVTFVNWIKAGRGDCAGRLWVRDTPQNKTTSTSVTGRNTVQYQECTRRFIGASSGIPFYHSFLAQLQTPLLSLLSAA